MTDKSYFRKTGQGYYIGYKYKKILLLKLKYSKKYFNFFAANYLV
jgi:hypothetical protein